MFLFLLCVNVYSNVGLGYPVRLSLSRSPPVANIHPRVRLAKCHNSCFCSSLALFGNKSGYQVNLLSTHQPGGTFPLVTDPMEAAVCIDFHPMCC